MQVKIAPDGRDAGRKKDRVASLRTRAAWVWYGGAILSGSFTRLGRYLLPRHLLKVAVGTFGGGRKSGWHLSPVVASCWEVTIKTAIGKLSLPVPLETLLEDVSRGFEVLAIRLEHVERLASLPRHHGDPFDRILVAQALVENRAIVTADAMLHRYPAQIFWTT